MTVKVLLLCIAAGAVCGITDGIVSTLLRRKHIIFTVISDIILAALLVGLHALISYAYCDGQFFPYAIFGQIASFILLRVLAAKLTRKVAAMLSPVITKRRQKRAERLAERKRKKARNNKEDAVIQTLA